MIENFEDNRKYITKEKIVVNKDIGYANIDSGAIYKESDEVDITNSYYSKLTALEFPTMKVIQQ